jgi:hypothetical protein
MGYGAHCRLATDGDEKDSMVRYCGEPQTMKVDDVWQLKPPANMAWNAWGQMNEALAERWEAR